MSRPRFAPRLSLGARQLLSFLTHRSWKNGYSWWRQDKLAAQFDRDVRTIGRWVAELVDSGQVTSARHGHGNYYFVKDLFEKVSDLGRPVDSPVQKPVEIGGNPVDGVRSDQTFLSDRRVPAPLSEIRNEIQEQQQERKLHQSDYGFPAKQNQTQKPNPDTPLSDALDRPEVQTVPESSTSERQDDQSASVSGEMAAEVTCRSLAEISIRFPGPRASHSAPLGMIPSPRLPTHQAEIQNLVRLKRVGAGP